MGEPFSCSLAVGKVECEFVEVDVFETKGWEWECGVGDGDQGRGFVFDVREFGKRFGLTRLAFSSWGNGARIGRHALQYGHGYSRGLG